MQSNRKLLLTGPLPDDYQDRLRKEFPDWRIVDCWQDRERVVEEIVDADVVFGRVRPEQFSAATRLVLIQSNTRGTDGMMFPELLESPVPVANAGDLYSPAMAEHTVGLILALYRNLPTYVRWQDRAQWNPEPLSFRMLRGRTVGFLGTGSIARETAALCRAFGCRLLGFNRRGGAATDPYERVVDPGGLDGLLGESDVVVNTLPYTPETDRLMTGEKFAAMKSGSLFVNVGRGRTVDEAALVEALRNGPLSGAGLDVFAQEPLPPESPLWAMANVVITGHRSGMGVDEAAGHYAVLAENLRRLRDGEALVNLVEKSRGY